MITNPYPVIVFCSECGKRCTLGETAIGGGKHMILCDKCGKVKRKKNGHIKKVGVWKKVKS